MPKDHIRDVVCLLGIQRQHRMVFTFWILAIASWQLPYDLGLENLNKAYQETRLLASWSYALFVTWVAWEMSFWIRICCNKTTFHYKYSCDSLSTPRKPRKPDFQLDEEIGKVRVSVTAFGSKHLKQPGKSWLRISHLSSAALKRAKWKIVQVSSLRVCRTSSSFLALERP